MKALAQNAADEAAGINDDGNYNKNYFIKSSSRKNYSKAVYQEKKRKFMSKNKSDLQIKIGRIHKLYPYFIEYQLDK